MSDRKSKYGTLIKRNGKVTLSSGSRTAVQVGRTVLVMQVKRKVHWSAVCRCLRSVQVRPEPVYRLDYNSNKDADIDRSDQNLIRRLNDRLVISAERGNV